MQECWDQRFLECSITRKGSWKRFVFLIFLCRYSFSLSFSYHSRVFGAAASLIKLFYMLKLRNEGVFNNAYTLLKVKMLKCLRSKDFFLFALASMLGNLHLMKAGFGFLFSEKLFVWSKTFCLCWLVVGVINFNFKWKVLSSILSNLSSTFASCKLYVVHFSIKITWMECIFFIFAQFSSFQTAAVPFIVGVEIFAIQTLVFEHCSLFLWSSRVGFIFIPGIDGLQTFGRERPVEKVAFLFKVRWWMFWPFPWWMATWSPPSYWFWWSKVRVLDSLWNSI